MEEKYAWLNRKPSIFSIKSSSLSQVPELQPKDWKSIGQGNSSLYDIIAFRHRMQKNSSSGVYDDQMAQKHSL